MIDSQRAIQADGRMERHRKMERGILKLTVYFWEFVQQIENIWIYMDTIPFQT